MHSNAPTLTSKHWTLFQVNPNINRKTTSEFFPLYIQIVNLGDARWCHVLFYFCRPSDPLRLFNPPVWIHQSNRSTSVERMALAHAMRLRPQKGIGWRSCHNETGHWMRLHHASPCFTPYHLLVHTWRFPTSLCLVNPCESQTSSSVLNLFSAVNHMRLIPKESIHHCPTIQDAKMLVATRETQQKMYNITCALLNLKSKKISIVNHTIPRCEPTNTYTIHSYMCIHNMLYLCINI